MSSTNLYLSGGYHNATFNNISDIQAVSIIGGENRRIRR